MDRIFEIALGWERTNLVSRLAQKNLPYMYVPSFSLIYKVWGPSDIGPGELPIRTSTPLHSPSDSHSREARSLQSHALLGMGQRACMLFEKAWQQNIWSVVLLLVISPLGFPEAQPWAQI